MARLVQFVGVGIIALGALWYVFYARTNAVEEGLLAEALSTGQPTYSVLVPVVNPQTQQGLLELAAATADANADDGAAELVAVNVLRTAGDVTRQNVEAERLEHQRDLLAGTRDIADRMGLSLRTRACVGTSVGEVILDVIEEEDVDQVVLGWRGSFTANEYAFGSNLDSILTDTPPAVTLVSRRQQPLGDAVALVGDGPNASAAVRRASEFATLDGGDGRPTLLNVQPRDSDSDENSPSLDAVRRGEERITAAAEEAGLDADAYDAEVLVGEDVESAVLDAIDQSDLACLGLVSESDLRAEPSGSLAERLHRDVTCNVAIARSKLSDPADSKEGATSRPR